MCHWNTAPGTVLAMWRSRDSAALIVASMRLRSLMSVRIAMYMVGLPWSSHSGTMLAFTQYRRPVLARLQISPCQTLPALTVAHRFSKKAASCCADLTMRWVWPISSSRLYPLISQNLSFA